MGTSGYAGEAGHFGSGGDGGGGGGGGFGGGGGEGGGGGGFVLLAHDGIPPPEIAICDTDDHLLVILVGGVDGDGSSVGGGWRLVKFLPVDMNVR